MQTQICPVTRCSTDPISTQALPVPVSTTLQVEVPRTAPALCGDPRPFKNSHSLKRNIVYRLNNLMEFSLSASFHYLYTIVLLGLPFFYAARASSVLDLEAAARDTIGNQEIIRSPINDRLDDTPDHHHLDVPGHRLQPSGRLQYILEISNPEGEPRSIVIVRPSPIPQPPHTPDIVPKFQAEWENYVNMRVAEWTILFTVACIFVAVSLTIFQIPEAINEPITRAFTSVAVFRAFSGVIYAPIFPLFFKSQYTRTPRFALFWVKETRKKRKVSTFWNPWVMISLPAASTLWALIFYFLAIFCVTWGMSSTAPTERIQSVTPLVIVTRGLIALSTFVDVTCLVGIMLTLRRFKALYSIVCDSSGSGNGRQDTDPTCTPTDVSNAC
ncbi:hypothetical protein BDZ94DRAFT_893988 [Collybia nuda]|uniref:Uncharacterized protein n=1 Tax=Collybia nuda TaxID=64659 RepID=A0A9P6CCD4_9AGAR|nr:hypothetical protein BDZ94DRAFT_893988 [Collybia nuda]